MEETRRRRPKSQATTSLAVANGDDGVSPRISQQRRRRKRRPRETPFPLLVLQVGATLLAVCLAALLLYRQIWPSTPVIDYTDDYTGATPTDDVSVDPQDSTSKSADSPTDDGDDDGNVIPNFNKADEYAKLEKLLAPETPPPLPTFDLSKSSQWDVFGMASKLNSTSDNSKNGVNISQFQKAAQELRQQYAEIYGGENIARMLLDRGLITPTQTETTPPSIIATACRLEQAQMEGRPFRVAFGGYSVTAGRGNLFEQSFPFQFRRLLVHLIQLAGIPDLEVVNAAIGGCPAFPYGWCMTNFWGVEPDVVSWDYSMNEAGGVPEGLEAYIRHVVSTYSIHATGKKRVPPKLIIKDTHLATQRQSMLDAYAELLHDPVVIATDPAVKPLLERKEAHRPEGFREWRKFGAPNGAPGQALHHPAVKEHEMIGWMLAMHFLTALEYLVAHPGSVCPSYEPPSFLPPPVSHTITGDNQTHYDGILFGHAASNNEWNMNPVQCRTTFQPILSGDLSELVVSGTTAEDLDILLAKSQMYYNKAWTLDMSAAEKKAKLKLSLYENALGFVDSKEAYYGIFQSPAMTLLLPYSNQDAALQIGDKAANWYQAIVICQVNEKRDATACNMGSDVSLQVGGVPATDKHMMKETGTLYLGKSVCLQVSIPQNATLTSHNELSGKKEMSPDQVGLLVELNVTNHHIAHISQACSVSHVVWEEKESTRDAT